MPHIIIEYTDNIANEAEMPTLLKKVNETLIAEKGVFPTGGIRARAIKLTDYCIADGSGNDAFVHVTLKIGGGRSKEVKKQVCDNLFQMIEEHFTEHFHNRYLALSMELYEFGEGGTYKKNNIHERFR
ncbi:5-carboxymethyl-2-hydroxymuconate Delta-isomerase [Virgibacillus siamensis]|uniref:5-carboxymethyl-2-hydroxymuconate Delta-isomerase n=1 Tax=Virgibacillus siamensis TaxID=480071 RepID=UPI0009843442|nr:5-carboxymethyl-2-hydroxymuconate Delta-isomerase [Virgibacillus siamensis]